MSEYFNRLLGINAVIDSTQQIVHFSRANFRFRIIERDGAAKTAAYREFCADLTRIRELAAYAANDGTRQDWPCPPPEP